MVRILLILCITTIAVCSAFAQTDIDVLYIQKTPVLNYDSSNGGWPVVGSTVTWNAKVKNWGTTTLPEFICEWYLNGQLVQTNTVQNLAAGETRNITFNWIWQQSPNELEFRADTTNQVAEVSELNNIYSITTNALTYGAWIEQSLYDHFHAHQIEMGDGANSFEDWCYRMIKKWNEMHSLAVWPATPNGVIDKIRVDKVVIVPDGALPLNGGLATNNPDRTDKTVDLMWGHPYKATDIQPGGFWDPNLNANKDQPFFIDYGEIHELNHARYIVDTYGFDCSHDQTNNNILITNLSGQLVAGTSQMPYSAWNVVYYNKSNDLMGGSRHYGEFTAGAWNRKTGIRGPYGNQNAPADIGVFLQNLPQNNYVKFIDNTGAPLTGATIYVYRATGQSGVWYGKYYDNTPDLTLTTDSNGTVNMGRCPFSANGTITHTYGLSNGTIVVRVVKNSQEYFTFMEVTDFNIEYWKGNTQNAYYTVFVPWGATNINTPVGVNQWRQEIYNSTNLTNLVDVKALDTNNLGGFALRMADRPISAGVGASNFSCKFTRDIWLNKGTYRFYIHTDDGGRLFVGETKYIDNWNYDGYPSKTATVTLDSAALRTVRLDHYDSGGPAIASVAIVPPKDTIPGADDWKMEIYNSTNFTNLVEVSACQKSNGEGFALNWGERAPGPTANPDNFSIRFSRTWTFAGGLYRFTTTSDEGVKLYIDGQLKIDHWTAHPPAEDTVEVTLTPGDHTVVVEYYDASGSALIALTVSHKAPDFDVRFIERTPRYDRYTVSYQTGIDPNEPGTAKPYLTSEEQSKKRWPTPGEMVTYTAHVKNIGIAPAACPYKWYFDGVEVASGTTPTLEPGEEYSVTHSRPWDNETIDHKIKFSADPDGLVGETFENNNIREDQTNALSVRIHVWQSLYNWFDANAKGYSDTASFDDWAQKLIENMNRLMAEAVYPGTPQGIPERVRLDEVVIEPDSAVDPDPSGIHAPLDLPWDIRYGFTNTLLADQGNGKNYFENNVSYLQTYDPTVVKSLAYQMGLIDYNNLSVLGISNSAQTGIGHPSTLEQSAITTGAPFFSEHEAYALTTNLHKRRGFSGEYLYDVPATIKIRVLDAYRRPMSANVKIYQEYPGKTIPATLRWDLNTDANGIATLPNRSCFGTITTATGHTLKDNPFGLINIKGENGLFFAKITKNTSTDYQFIEILPINIAYWLGYQDEFTYDLQTAILVSKPTTSDLYGVDMYSNTLGFAVGASGKILKWDGNLWSSQSSGCTQSLLGVDISPDGTQAVACGNLGSVTIWNGSSWAKKPYPVTNSMFACAALGSSTFLVGGSAVSGGAYDELYRSTDNGATWTKITAVPSTQSAIRSMSFYDTNKGILAAANAPLYVTSDGGMSWTPSTGISTGEGSFYDCTMPSINTGWTANSAGKVYTSTSAGASWNLFADYGTSRPWNGIDMTASGNGWAVTPSISEYGTTLVRRFENNRWFNMPICTSGTQAPLNDVSCSSDIEGWAVGKGGVLIKLAKQDLRRTAACSSLEEAKSLPDGTFITISENADLYVSAIFPESVYLEKGDRSGAIRVYTNSGAPISSKAELSGILATENGERVINFGTVTPVSGSKLIEPIAMNTRSLGGLPNWIGTSNLAILVRIAGRVTNVGPNWITIDDGSGLIASDGFPGVKIRCDMLSIPNPAPTFAAITGVSTTESVNGQIYKVVRPRNDSDMQQE